MMKQETLSRAGEAVRKGNSMIDLHNHILPGVDDGATDLAESLAIARQFVTEGVSAVAATPHLDPLNRRGIPAAIVRERVREVNSAVQAEGIGLTILPGSEIFLTPDVPDLLERGVAAPIAGGPWVVVELPFNQRPLYLEDTLFRIEVAGFQPILAHPERYAFVQGDPHALDELVDRGLILQLTAPSLLGEYGGRVRRTAETLLRRGRYALAASDRHHPGPPRSLADLRSRIAQLTSEESANLLLACNPAHVVAGEQVDLPAPEDAHSSLLARLFRGR